MLLRRKKILWPIIFVCLVLIAGLAFVSGRISHKAANPNVIQGNDRKQRVDAAVVTIRPTGFEPKEITRQRGPFLLVVDNRSNNPDVLLRLDHESGRREHEERINHGKIDWRKPFDLHPGRYVLTEANHPNWICHITIIE